MTNHDSHDGVQAKPAQPQLTEQLRQEMRRLADIRTQLAGVMERLARILERLNHDDVTGTK